VRNWKHNLLASVALGIAVALFLFISNYLPTFSGEGGATSHWRNAEGGKHASVDCSKAGHSAPGIHWIARGAIPGTRRN
jgi:hypothetical protein